MNMRRWVGVGAVLVVCVVAVTWRFSMVRKGSVVPVKTSVTTTNDAVVPSSQPDSAAAPVAANPTIVAPVADFKARITKKKFGRYITPATSPVQPERFTGYHTGVDVEYGDVVTDVPVYAAVDATVTMAQWVSGYGGLLVLHGSINGQDRYVLYGHVRASSLPAVGKIVKQGSQVGVLGMAYSHETDSERRHLHFAIYAKSPVDIRGYVQKQSDLSSWEDPLSYYP